MGLGHGAHFMLVGSGCAAQPQRFRMKAAFDLAVRLVNGFELVERHANGFKQWLRRQFQHAWPPRPSR
jgi:hypothetical protein